MSPGGWRGRTVFVLAGVLSACTGSLLIAWQYQIDADPKLIGLHFLFLTAGFAVAALSGERLLRRISLRLVSLLACLIGFLGFLALSFAGPPAQAWSRLFGLSLVGLAGGCCMTSLLHGPALSLSVSEVLFGSGCLLAALISGATYYFGSVQAQTILLAMVPLIIAMIYLPGNGLPQKTDAASAIPARGVRNIATVLFCLLLLFQFGNELAIAGWLPLFLIHRLGSRPDLAIFTLALFFLTLILGRLLARSLLWRISRRKMLSISFLLAVFGYVLLSSTNSLLGAAGAIVVVGAGFAPVYPIVAETLDSRFAYQPGFYSGIFTIALTGAMCTPWLLGYVDAYLGMQYVMLMPAIGSTLVFILALLIMLEARVMGEKSKRSEQGERAFQ